ncbi:MAG: D-alanine--D-alanine ligase [Patescibacteria group bacterium]|nr:D-alanine--D-alanine ligase [Patescibacteria group bacterium]
MRDTKPTFSRFFVLRGSSKFGIVIIMEREARKTSKKKKVAVLMGGPSTEHETSIKSGKNVLRAINREKYEPIEIFINREGKWPIEPHEVAKSNDVAFIALHGTYGEDGTIQMILDELKIPYTGSNAAVSALGMNKFLSLRLFRAGGLITPLSFLISKNDFEKTPIKFFEFVRYYLGFPVVVKPNDNGSSIGASIVRNQDELLMAIEEVFKISREALLQNFIKGREVTCGVLDHGFSESAYPLLPTEIIPQVSHFFDYRAKYELNGSFKITPARLPGSILKEIQRVAVKVHKLVGAKGFSRTDMILGEDGKIYVLEVNTIPGLTENCLMLKAAEASGISFSNLIERIIEAALRYHG